MWVVAGLLLGAFVVLIALGLHTGPHSHLLGAAIGAVAAVWLLVMAALGQSRTILWVLLGADAFASVGIGLAARHSLRHLPARARLRTLVGREGVALSALVPEGIVRVGGEEWSATSLNGPVHRGGRIEVVDHQGIRLEVWGVADPAIGTSPPPDEERKAGPSWS